MSIKYDKIQISSISELQRANPCRNKSANRGLELQVPSKKTFDYILKRAQDGNEMAVVQLDEWQKFCKASSPRDTKVIGLINSAIKDILK